MIKPTVKQITSDSAISGPQFSFSEYAVNTVYHNDGQKIDFVTDGEDLYVFAVRNDENEPTTKPTLKEEAALGRFIKLVSKGNTGKDGAPGKQGPAGEVPRISARFDGKQLILKSGTETIAVTGDLTGPAWKPEKQGDQIVWMETKDRTRPEPIDLSDLRERERPLLLRVDSDNTKRSDEISGPANMIQWKYEGDEHWTNLIAIDDLLNIALAGVCTWKSEEDGNWHIGHKEVVKATYDSNKDGKRIISQVELGDVLFDAGPIAKDMQLDIAYLEARLNEIEEILRGINIPSLDGYATEDWVNAQGFLKNIPDTYAKKSDIPTDYVKFVKLNGESHSPVNGIVDLGNIESGTVDAYTKAESDARYQPKGNYLTQHQSLKTINGQSLVGTGNITISAGGISLFDIKIENGHLYKTSDGENWIDLGAIGGSGSEEGCPECWTREQIQALIDASLEGLNLPEEWVTFADLDRFITISDLADYATKNYVESRIQDAMTDQGDLDYYRIFTLYQRTNSRTTAPNAPVQGNFVWDTSKGEIVLQPTFTSDWENHPQNATSDKPYLWQATATYSYKSKSEIKGDNETEYWHVVCLTGEPGINGTNGYNGTDGADGNGVEFIYKLVDSLEEYRGLDTPVAPEGEGDDDIPEGWTDHPSGISEEHPIEVASVRKYNGAAKQWSDYSSPFIWSMWGEDGMDGDGVEYIFFVAAEDIVIADTATGKFTLDPSRYLQPSSPNFIPTDQQMVIDLGPSYQKSDWISDVDNNWTDNPSDIDANQPFEFVSIRKHTDENGWGPFCTPKLWGHFGGITITPTQIVYGSTSYKPYTCYAFHRDANDLSQYSVVYDFSAFGVDSYSELTDEQKNMFYTAPQNYAKTLDENNNVVSIVWQDTVPVGNDQLWLITAHIGDENQASDTGWTSPVRWGDRAGFQVEYSNDSKAEAVYLNPALWNNNHLTLNDFSGTDEEREEAWEAAVRANYGVWSDNIEAPEYMATSVLLSSGVWSNWTVAKIKGETGRTGDTGPQGKDGSPGADGTDIEFVYFRTDSENHRPEMSETYGTYDGETKVSEDLYKDDFLPLAIGSGFTLNDPELKIDNDFFWHDHPAGVNESLTCEWIGMRHSSYQNGQKLWGEFNIALWSKFGADGRDGDGIEYVFWGLSEEQNSQITCTWPTQKESNTENGGCNVDPTRSYNNKNIDDSGYLPAILINNIEVPAVDNNPGIKNYKYVYASKRKYNGATKTWGEFSEIKLWNEQSDSELNNVVLDITNDTHTIYVDEEGRITDRYMSYSGYSTGNMYLYRNLVLLSNAEVFISDGSRDVQIVSLKEPVENNCYEKVSGSYLTMTQHGVTATVTASYVWKYDDSNSSKVELKVAFNRDNDNKNPILTDSFDIIIKVKSTIGDYIGTDVLRLVPKHSDKEIELLSVPRTQRTSSEGSHDYSDSEFNFYGYYGYDVYPTLDLLSKTHYFFKYDDQANWTEFYIPLSDYTNPNYQKLSILKNQYDGKAEATSEYTHFYFDINGNSVSSSNDAFYEIWLYNTDFRDNNHGQWTRWSMQAYVYPAKFVANDNYPINELYFGIGFDNGPIDEANVHIVYPGKDGQQGPVGPAGQDGKDGKDGEPGKTVVTYQYLNGKVIRMSNWTDDQLEYSDGETAVDGVYYLDVVKHVSGSTTSYYKCISDVTYSNSNKPSDPSDDSNNWELFTPQSDAWFETMLANSAYIENLTSKQVVITDSNNIVAGMASGADIAAASDNQTVGNVRIWAGTPTTNGDLTTAPFTVNADGSVRASNIDLAGGHVSGSFTIGANGRFSTRSTGSGNTTQTVITSGSVTNTSYTGSSISSEAKLGDGKVVVADNFSDFNVYSELESQHLTFYNRSNGMPNSWQSITTPYVMNGYYGSQSTDWGSVFKIQSISQSAYNALTVPDNETLYIII